MKYRLGLGLLLAAGIFVSPPSRAQESPKLEQARAYFNAGAKAYATKKYVAAVQAFEEAYHLSKREGLLFSIAQAYRKHYSETQNPASLHLAIEHYREYLTSGTEQNRHQEAEDAIKELEPLAKALAGTTGSATGSPQEFKRTTQLMITSDTPGAHLSLDTRANLELPYIAEINPGPHQIAVTAPGFVEYRRSLRVLEGTVVPIDVPLKEQAGLLTVRASTQATIAIDGRLVGNASLVPLELTPGPHQIAVTMNGKRPFLRELQIQRGGQTEVDAKLQTTLQRKVAWGILGLGAASWIASGVLAVSAYERENHADGLLQKRDRENLTLDEVKDYDQARATRSNLKTGALIFSGVGLALGAIGFTLFQFDHPQIEQPSASVKERGPSPSPNTPIAPSMEVSIRGNAGGSGLVLQGQF